MKVRSQFQIRRGNGTSDTAESYHAESAPNSSVVLAVSVLAEIEDVLAVIRTAAILGNSFRTSTSVNVLGKDTVCIESGMNLTRESLDRVLDSIQTKLRAHRSSQPPVFALEANISAASFLRVGTISVHIRNAVSIPEPPILAR